MPFRPCAVVFRLRATESFVATIYFFLLPLGAGLFDMQKRFETSESEWNIPLQTEIYFAPPHAHTLLSVIQALVIVKIHGTKNVFEKFLLEKFKEFTFSTWF